MLGVTYRKGQTLVSIRTSDTLWGELGFMSKVFEPFASLGVSVDLVAISQYTVGISLDYIPGGVTGEVFQRLQSRLAELGTVSVKTPTAVVSIVGENLREALPELGAALEDMRNKNVYLMSQSSEDLSLSFVVDEESASNVVQSLHNILLCGTSESGTCAVDDTVFGQSWDELKTEFLKVEAR